MGRPLHAEPEPEEMEVSTQPEQDEPVDPDWTPDLGLGAPTLEEVLDDDSNKPA